MSIEEMRKRLSKRREELLEQERRRTWYRSLPEEHRNMLRTFGIAPASAGYVVRRTCGKIE